MGKEIIPGANDGASEADLQETQKIEISAETGYSELWAWNKDDYVDCLDNVLKVVRMKPKTTTEVSMVVFGHDIRVTVKADENGKKTIIGFQTKDEVPELIEKFEQAVQLPFLTTKRIIANRQVKV